jgi:hypothetical protein
MIFKKGDRVYDHAYGWGNVIMDDDGDIFPVIVEFNCIEEDYTLEGNLYTESNHPPTLSFTEYTLEGFSQERPKEELPFKVGDVVYASDDGGFTWSTSILKTINKEESLPFVTSYAFWKYIALENPLLFPNTKIYTKEDL